MLNDSRKIFGIGLNKTGTTTLGQCGKLMGYRSASCNKNLLEDVVLRNDFSNVKEWVNQYDLFEDWPWPLIYKELDQMFPGSKFILTVRSNENVWFDSLKRHSMATHPFDHCRKLAYGYNFPHWHKKKHVEFYTKHNNEVSNYFSGRKQDFLELNWENGDGLEKLCTFLDKDKPDTPTPHANRGSARRIKTGRLVFNKLLCVLGY